MSEGFPPKTPVWFLMSLKTDEACGSPTFSGTICPPLGSTSEVQMNARRR
jgi:hypothetical protein